MRRIRAIIFDFDGVILDSVDCKTRAFARLFAPWGPDAVQRIVEYHQAHGGISRFEKFRYFYSEILRRPLPDEEFDRLCSEFQTLAFDEVLASAWIAGAREFLEQYHDRYLLFVASGTPVEELRDIVQRRGLEHLFTEVHGSPERKEPIIRGILARHELLASEVVFVGDAMTDYQAAQETGLMFIGVTGQAPSVFPDGTRTIPDLRTLADALDLVRENGEQAQ